MSRPRTRPLFPVSDRVDAIAARLIAQAAPVRFAIAESAAERAAVYRLRQEIVVEKGWARPEEFPNGLERDPFDERAVQIAGWDGPILAAAGRLVLPAPGHLLPTEQVCGLVIEPRGRVADVGRVCVAPAYRDPRHRVFWGLDARIWRELRGRGFEAACCLVTASLARVWQRYHRRWGLQVVIMGLPRPHVGEERCPVLIRAADAL